MRALFAAFLFIQACSTSPQLGEPVVGPAVPGEASETTTDEALLEALQQWKADCYVFSAYDCRRLAERVDSIQVQELEDGTIGTCKIATIGSIVFTRRVYIDPVVLQDKTTLRAVLAHEMGHCALLINHVTTDDSHLMAPYMLPPKVLEARLPAMLARFYADAQAKVLPGIEGITQ